MSDGGKPAAVANHWGMTPLIERSDRTSTAAGPVDVPPEFTPPPVERPVIDGYEVLGPRPVSSGGMGDIWKAIRLSDRRAVAIKVPQPGTDRALFRREVEALKRLDHPNIVKHLDDGEYQGASGPRPYLVMEYVYEAKSIKEYAREHRLSLRQRLRLFLQLCSAVAYLHSAAGGRKIHRDLKPENIQINAARPVTGEQGAVHWPLGQVKLIDLGIASTVEPDRAVFERAWESGEFGTPEYMSPEQFRPGAEALDERSDIYALGVVLYELVVGTLPYPPAKQHRPAVRLAILNHEIQPPAATARELKRSGRTGLAPCECGGDLERIILKALEFSRAERFASVDAGAGDLDLAENIRALLASRPLPMRREAGYRGWMTARRGIRNRAAWAVVLVLAVVSGMLGPRWLFTAASELHGRWERWALSARPDVFEEAPVLMITYGEDTDYAYLAKAAGLPQAGDAPSMRRVLGLLFERLAEGRPGVVIVDKKYEGPTVEDDAFERGVKSLHAIGRSVVVMGNHWFGQDPAQVEQAVKFSRSVVWGIAWMSDMLDRAWRVFAAQVGPDGVVRPSMAAAAVALYERGPTPLTWSLDASKDELVARAGGPGGHEIRIPLTGATTAGVTAPHQDLRPDTYVGYYAIEIPPQATIDAKSIDLAEFMKLSPVRRNALISRKLIVIGQVDHPGDTHPYLGTRMVPGLVAHAVTAGRMLLNKTIIMAKSPWPELGLVTAAAGLGMLAGAAGIRAARRLVRDSVAPAGRGVRAARALARGAGAVIAAALPITVLLAAILWITKEVFVRFSVLHSPLIYMATALVAAGLAIPLFLSRINYPWETES